MKVQLYLTPRPLDAAALENKTVVVIDVLRSSTSICAALLAGARSVIPTAEPGESGELWSKLGAENAVLAGERNGVKIDNFQYGNSPAEFTPEAVGDRHVVLCTTNGTGVFGKVGKASRVVSGGIVNLGRVGEVVAGWGNDVAVICSGRENGFSIEDTLCGGMLIDRLNNRHGCAVSLNDAGSLAQLMYREMGSNLVGAIAQGEHGRFLASLGFGDDVEMCSTADSMPVVPILEDGRLVKLNSTAQS